MGEPFLAEIRLFSCNFPPKGWAFCNGQLLPINQNQALFSLLGTTYGGDGRTTFALPDLRGRVPIHLGDGWIQGEKSGEERHTLITSEMPAHTHMMQASNLRPNREGANGNYLAAAPNRTFTASSPNTTLNPGLISPVGGSQPHPNMQPYLVISFCIALQGIFPSRN